MFRSFAVAASLVAALTSGSAFAQYIALSVGETKTLTVSRRVAKLEIDNPEVVSAERDGQKALAITAKGAGKTALRFWTPDGTEFEFMLYVTSAGRVEPVFQSAEGPKGRVLSLKRAADGAAPAEPAQDAPAPAATTDGNQKKDEKGSVAYAGAGK